MTKLYAIGDIHGCYNAFLKILAQIYADIEGDAAKIVFMGDYVDRGPQSWQVIQHLRDLQNAKNPKNKNIEYVFLRGNHEDMLLDYLSSSSTWGFLNNGGRNTMLSYEDAGANLREDLDFYRSLVLYHQHDDIVFVHAGMHPYARVEDQYEETLLWTRDWNDYDEEYAGNVFVVHGHTPVMEVDRHKNQLNIDTGCVYGKTHSAYGNLTAVRIDDRNTFTFFTAREYEVDKNLV